MAELLLGDSEEITERSINRLSNSTQITRLETGSKARALIDIFASELERAEEIIGCTIIEKSICR